MVSDDMNLLTIKAVHCAHMRVAETHCIDDDRVEYCL
jgi:hypothetical protein